MKRSTKAAITVICIILIVLIGGTMYVYNQVEQILSMASLPQLLESDSQDKLATFNSPKAPENNSNITTPENNDNQQTNVDTPSTKIDSQAQTQPNTKQPKSSTPSSSAPSENPALNDKIASTLQKEANKPVETSDLLTAGLILMSKLNKEEINFLMGFSDKKYTSEELKELRKLLLAKLSSQDVETLRGLADKYGRNLYILDPSVPIK